DVERVDLARGEGDLGRLAGRAVAGVHQLHGEAGRVGGDRGELEEAVGVLDLAVLEPEPLLLERAEELLDGPAPPVPIDNAPGRRVVLDRMRRQKPPFDRLDAVGWSALDELD